MVGARRSVVVPRIRSHLLQTTVAPVQAVQNGEGQLIPLHDVAALVRTQPSLSDASYVRELVLPAIADERF
jgi:hypothetical protein